jgi:hypothetical protein
MGVCDIRDIGGSVAIDENELLASPLRKLGDSSRFTRPSSSSSSESSRVYTTAGVDLAGVGLRLCATAASTFGGWAFFHASEA